MKSTLLSRLFFILSIAFIMNACDMFKSDEEDPTDAASSSSATSSDSKPIEEVLKDVPEEVKEKIEEKEKEVLAELSAECQDEYLTLLTSEGEGPSKEFLTDCFDEFIAAYMPENLSEECETKYKAPFDVVVKMEESTCFAGDDDVKPEECKELDESMKTQSLDFFMNCVEGEDYKGIFPWDGDDEGKDECHEGSEHSEDCHNDEYYQYCYTNPEAEECKDKEPMDYCKENPEDEKCKDYVDCSMYPEDPMCQGYVDCEKYPEDEKCKNYVDCSMYPEDPMCKEHEYVDCEKYPEDEKCKEWVDCEKYPEDEKCKEWVDCEKNPEDPMCKEHVDCEKNPEDPMCQEWVDCEKNPEDERCQAPDWEAMIKACQENPEAVECYQVDMMKEMCETMSDNMPDCKYFQ